MRQGKLQTAKLRLASHTRAMTGWPSSRKIGRHTIVRASARRPASPGGWSMAAAVAIALFSMGTVPAVVAAHATTPRLPPQAPATSAPPALATATAAQAQAPPSAPAPSAPTPPASAPGAAAQAATASATTAHAEAAASRWLAPARDRRAEDADSSRPIEDTWTGLASTRRLQLGPIDSTESFEDAAWGSLGLLEALPDAPATWTRKHGSTPTPNTGPSSAHDGNFYLFTEADSHLNQDFVLDVLPVFSESSELELWYHMYGSDVGSLTVEMAAVGSSSWMPIWSMSGQQQTSYDDAWRRAVIPIQPTTASMVRIHAVTGSGAMSDIAIDGVWVHEPFSDCSGVTAPPTGTLGTCSVVNGILAHETQCSMTCENGLGVVPVACWNGRLSQPSGCCTSGSVAEWSGRNGTACVQCAPGSSDHDSDASTPCESCRPGRYQNVTGNFGNCSGVCPSGTYAIENSTFASDCVQCSAGSSDHDRDASTPCVRCRPGRYTTFSNNTGAVGDCVGECPRFTTVVSRLNTSLIDTSTRPSTTAPTGLRGVNYRRWNGIGGTGVTVLLSHSNYNGNPPDHSSVMMDFFEAPVNVCNNCGTEMDGYFKAKTSGLHTFRISADDNAHLWFGANVGTAMSSPEIASVPGWTSNRQWSKYSEQVAAPITLTADSYYYMRAIANEGGGGDNLEVGVTTPDGTMNPIPVTAGDGTDYLFQGVAASGPSGAGGLPVQLVSAGGTNLCDALNANDYTSWASMVSAGWSHDATHSDMSHPGVAPACQEGSNWFGFSASAQVGRLWHTMPA